MPVCGEKNGDVMYDFDNNGDSIDPDEIADRLCDE